MFDRKEETTPFNRSYFKSQVSKDEKLSQGIDEETTEYLNGLTDFQILELQKELKSTVGDGLVNKYKNNEPNSTKETTEELDINAIEMIKNKYKDQWSIVTKSKVKQQEFDLPTEFTEDQLLTALSSKETTLIAHSLAYLKKVNITKWDILSNRLLPLLVHRSKLVRLRAYDILYLYDSLPVAVIDLLKKSRFDGDLAQHVLQELQQ